jgi:hypothetical protein
MATPVAAALAPGGDEVLAAVRLTGGLGSAMVIGSSVMASSLTNSGKCAEVVGTMSVGLLGAMLMFAGMLPVTQGVNTKVVWATGIAQFLLIVFIAITIIRLLTLARVCPAFAPQTANCDGSAESCAALKKAQCGSGTRRGMAKVAAGTSILTIVYTLMVLPGPHSKIGEMLGNMFGSLGNLKTHMATALGSADPALAGGRARAMAMVRGLMSEWRGVLFAILAITFFGLGVGLPFTGIAMIADACKKTTAG